MPPLHGQDDPGEPKRRAIRAVSDRPREESRPIEPGPVRAKRGEAATAARRAVKIALDRRKHRRVPVLVFGRFMREDKQDYPCQVLNMSAGGMTLLAPVLCSPGERIVAYLENFGRIEAVVVRPIEGGFAASIVASLRKREKIVNLLTWLINRDSLGLAEDRRHERIVPRSAASKLILPNGEMFDCRVIDVSLSGASIASDVRPRIGTAVVLGRMRGRVARHHELGVAIQFAELQDPDSVSRSFG
jgi:hypothetical protein